MMSMPSMLKWSSSRGVEGFLQYVKVGLEEVTFTVRSGADIAATRLDVLNKPTVSVSKQEDS